MKGLLYKDWYLTLKYCRVQLAVIAVMTVVSLLADVGVSYIVYPMLFAGMIPVYLLSADEKDGWNEYAVTMPVTRRELVTEKYVVALVSLLAALAFMALLWLARLAVAGGELSALARVLPLAGAVGLAYPAVVLPMMFRFGVEKGRFIAAAAVAVILVPFIFLELGRNVELAAAQTIPVMPWLLPAAAAVFALSWLIAVRLYETRKTA